MSIPNSEFTTTTFSRSHSLNRTLTAFRNRRLSLSCVRSVGQSTDGYGARPETPRIDVTGQALAWPTPSDETKLKLDHIMKEVAGTEITVTKKTTVIKLDEQPPIINNNQQEIFSKAPGASISQQQTPGQFNFSYRGPQSPRVGIHHGLAGSSPARDRLGSGFPTLYYTPLPQSISEIQVIRGGSGLLSTAQSLPQQLTM